MKTFSVPFVLFSPYFIHVFEKALVSAKKFLSSRMIINLCFLGKVSLGNMKALLSHADLFDISVLKRMDEGGDE